MCHILKKIINFSLDTYYLNKKNHLLLAAYPKVGSTWLRFLFCNLLSLQEWGGKTVDFDILNKTMPGFGSGHLKKKWLYKSVPHIVVTHKKYHKFLFGNQKVFMILRDPRDAMISRYHFERARKKNPFKGNLLDLMQHPKFGLRNFFEHYYSWEERVNAIVKYESLKQKPIQSFLKLLKKLNIPANRKIVQESVNRSDFNYLRSIEESGGHTRHQKKFKKGSRFTRKGEANQWKDAFSKEEKQYYQKVSKKYNFNYNKIQSI